MKLLLDTHALLWWSAGDNRLSEKAIRYIDEAEFVCFSIVSLWEIGIKMGGLGYDFDMDERWEESLPQKALSYDIEQISISPNHCRLISDLPRHHGDPFDRMLIAQAIMEDYTILSKDGHFDVYGVTRVW